VKKEKIMESNSDTEIDTEEIGNEGWKYTNCTNSFVLPYWLFGFKDIKLQSYVCCSINIPSGVSDKRYGLEGKVECKVSTCGTKLTLTCEWPATWTTASCLQDALSQEWNAETSSMHGRFNTSSTVSNILLACQEELFKLQLKNKVSSDNMSGSNCTIDLAYQVEQKMVLCSPVVDCIVGSVNLYVVLKKVSTKNDEE
jgi:hypothetical protein